MGNKGTLIKWQRGKISFDLEKWSFDHNLNNARHPEFSNEVNIFLENIRIGSYQLQLKKS